MTGVTPLFVGVLFGLALAAPVGPVNVLCLRRTLAAGFGAGLAAGLGAALADSLYAVGAAFGVGAVAAAVSAHAGPIRFAVGLVLLASGFALWRRPLADRGAEPRVPRHAGGFAAAFLLTLANPLPALSLGTAFGLGGGLGDAADAGAPFVVGVLAGSMLWWTALAAAAAAARRRLAGDALRAVSRASALLLSLCGLVALAAAG